MKCKVRLSYAVEMFVEGESEEAIMDWLCSKTPEEARKCAKNNGNMVFQDYEEEILCFVNENTEVDYVIKEEL